MGLNTGKRRFWSNLKEYSIGGDKSPEIDRVPLETETYRVILIIFIANECLNFLTLICVEYPMLKS